MKLPKLPWWGWLLALYTLAGVALKFRLWGNKENAGLGWQWVFAPVLLLLRWLPDGSAPDIRPLKLWSDLSPDAQNPGGQATRDELAYTDYLTSGLGAARLDFDAWVAAGKPKV